MPIANRNRVEAESLIGVFLNMVAHRTDAAGDPPFRTLLARVRDAFVASIPHQEIPFERLVEALQPQRDMSRAPVFQIQLSLQNTPSERLELPGLTLTQLEVHNRTTKFDFTVFLFDLPGGAAHHAGVQHRPVRRGDDRPPARALADPARWRGGRPVADVVGPADAGRGRARATVDRLERSGRQLRDAPALHRLFELQAELRRMPWRSSMSWRS